MHQPVHARSYTSARPMSRSLTIEGQPMEVPLTVVQHALAERQPIQRQMVLTVESIDRQLWALVARGRK